MWGRLPVPPRFGAAPELHFNHGQGVTIAIPFHSLTPEITLSYAGKVALGDPGSTE